jgi:hypothetical protein
MFQAMVDSESHANFSENEKCAAIVIANTRWQSIPVQLGISTTL